MKSLFELDARIDKCKVEIDSRNRRNFVLLATGALIISVPIFAASLIFKSYSGLMLSHGLLFVYCLAMFFMAKYCDSKKTPYIRVAFYAALTPIMIIAILFGSFLDTKNPAITLIILICILPIFLIDKLWRIILFQLAATGIFVICSYLAKSPEMFHSDVLYLPIYIALGIGTNIFTLIFKVENAENFVGISFESEHDPLTTLLNRRSGEEMVAAMFDGQTRGALAIIDIDDFKLVNDSYGHQAGDFVLQQVSQIMKAVFRTTDVIWRLGGDEFAIFAVNVISADICRKRFDEVMHRIRQLQIPGYEELAITVSIGCAICNEQRMTFDDAYRESDDALYQAKKAGKDRLVIFDTSQ